LELELKKKLNQMKKSDNVQEYLSCEQNHAPESQTALENDS